MLHITIYYTLVQILIQLKTRLTRDFQIDTKQKALVKLAKMFQLTIFQ